MSNRQAIIFTAVISSAVATSIIGYKMFSDSIAAGIIFGLTTVAFMCFWNLAETKLPK